MRRRTDEEQYQLQKKKKQRKLHRKILGFCLFTFLLGFFFGRIVLAAEQNGWESRGTEDWPEESLIRTEEASGRKSEAGQESNIGEALETDSGTYDQKAETGQPESWNLVLVNREHPLTAELEMELTQVGDGHQVDSRIARALLDMLAAGKREGHEIWITSSYRTWEKQTKLYENKVAKLRRQGYSETEARQEAATVVAVPGTSEHQLGLAVDLVSSEYTVLDEGQERTKAYQWLVKHCAEYGFILRYPNGKTELTGIIYEPWHFRYVGKEAAREIMERGICLEEYLEEIQA